MCSAQKRTNGGADNLDSREVGCCWHEWRALGESKPMIIQGDVKKKFKVRTKNLYLSQLHSHLDFCSDHLFTYICLTALDLDWDHLSDILMMSFQVAPRGNVRLWWRVGSSQPALKKWIPAQSLLLINSKNCLKRFPPFSATRFSRRITKFTTIYCNILDDKSDIL